MSAFLDRLGRAAARHRWVIAAWVVLVLVVVGAAKAAEEGPTSAPGPTDERVPVTPGA